MKGKNHGVVPVTRKPACPAVWLPRSWGMRVKTMLLADAPCLMSEPGSTVSYARPMNPACGTRVRQLYEYASWPLSTTLRSHVAPPSRLRLTVPEARPLGGDLDSVGVPWPGLAW